MRRKLGAGHTAPPPPLCRQVARSNMLVGSEHTHSRMRLSRAPNGSQFSTRALFPRCTVDCDGPNFRFNGTTPCWQGADRQKAVGLTVDQVQLLSEPRKSFGTPNDVSRVNVARWRAGIQDIEVHTRSSRSAPPCRRQVAVGLGQDGLRGAQRAGTSHASRLDRCGTRDTAPLAAIRIR